MSQNNQKSIGWAEIGMAVGFVLLILTMLWLVFRDKIAKLYHAARHLETAGLWNRTGWGQYFGNPPPGKLEILSIYKSSLPFGFLCGILILALGLFMMGRVRSKHIITYLRPDPDNQNAMPWNKLMMRFAPHYPHNEFFVKFPMYRYSSTTGPASQPMSALELMAHCGAILVDEDAPAADGKAGRSQTEKSAERLVDRSKIREALIEPFGAVNPFLGISLRNEAPVRAAVDQLSWYAATILYAALVRVNSLHDPSADIKKTVDASEDYLRDVWRAINKEKSRLGDKLVIGPYDYPDPLKKPPKKKNKKGKQAGSADVKQDTPEGMILLVDHLAEVGPKFPTTKKARDELVKILVKPSIGLNPKKPVDVIDRICQGHGFVFGVLASCLTDGKSGTLEAARATGVMAPNTFLWLRFADRGLWRFLNYVGMQTPCPEAAGMFDHWQMELVLRSPRTRPEIAETTINAIVFEARKQSPDALTARDLDSLNAAVSGATKASLDVLMAASESWNDDAKPAPTLTPNT